MNRLLLTAIIAIMSTLSTEAQNIIALPVPDFGRPALTLMNSLNARRSIRSYSSRMLSMQDLSDLLWAAQGLSDKQIPVQINPVEYPVD